MEIYHTYLTRGEQYVDTRANLSPSKLKKTGPHRRKLFFGMKKHAALPLRVCELIAATNAQRQLVRTANALGREKTNATRIAPVRTIPPQICSPFALCLFIHIVPKSEKRRNV